MAPCCRLISFSWAPTVLISNSRGVLWLSINGCTIGVAFISHVLGCAFFICKAFVFILVWLQADVSLPRLHFRCGLCTALAFLRHRFWRGVLELRFCLIQGHSHVGKTDCVVCQTVGTVSTAPQMYCFLHSST